MKKVYQTKFGEHKGNCMAACIASLLEVDIEDVCDLEDGDSWWTALRKWWGPRGYSPLEVNWPIATDSESEHIFPNEGQVCWAVGKSPRGDFKHAVLVKWLLGEWVVFHDPHPDDTGLDGPVEIVGMLVPIDPFKNPMNRRNNKSRRINCCVCGRQIVSYRADNRHIVGGRPPTIMVGTYCCHICAEELDENGLFPEERTDKAHARTK